MRFRRFLLCTASVILSAPCAFAQTAGQQDTFPYPPARIDPNVVQAPAPQQRGQRPLYDNRGPVDPRRDYINSSSGQKGVQATGRTL
ncbi:MAG: hypothetical protein J0L97_01885, partial [Alphaproteobacteria bacterium]|nr:hypothetical protein [Alphaproteobacteria bacterium]